MQAFSQPPVMVRMADGTYVPAAQTTPNRPKQGQKLLIVLQYYEGDKEAAEELGALIADLERIRNKDADILIFRRFDASEFSRSVRTKLEDKFEKVYFETCRRKDATSYPFAPNQMWGDLVTLVAQYNPWFSDYYAFLPLETDCVPVHPGWIRELADEFRSAKAAGLAAVGHIHDNPRTHLNGVAVYDINLWRIVGGGKLNGADPQSAYDIYHARDILPVAKDTPLVMFEYQRPTITADDLFRAWKQGVEPALFHGVKDASAREAVRARHVAFTEQRDLSRRTVFTYMDHGGSQQMIAMWMDGWRSRGWNPVCLRDRDAIRDPNYLRVTEAVKKFFALGDKKEQERQFIRWVALHAVGGGLMVDPWVLPADFTPKQLDDLQTGITVFHGSDLLAIAAAFIPRQELEEFFAAVANHGATPDDVISGRPYVSDMTVLRSTFLGEMEYRFLLSYCGDTDWRSAPLVAFDPNVMMARQLRGDALGAMEQFLRGA